MIANPCTVEDPSESFQRLRDYVDATNCMTLPSFSPDNLIKGFNKNMTVEANEKFKINKVSCFFIFAEID